MDIKFPKMLQLLLEDSVLKSPIEDYAQRVGSILLDNQLPFFPDYTDHGVAHINDVLETECDLVPDEVWEQSARDSRPRLLCDSDAAVLIGGTLLHDIAMHLREDGFRELIQPGSRFQPIRWFNQDSDRHSADRPWHELWEDYVHEARRFSERVLNRLVGPKAVRKGFKFTGLPENYSDWTRNHRLIIGEFLRRHHARLAHEIAMHGFPGLQSGSGEGSFPVLNSQGHALKDYAELFGLVAHLL